MRMLQLILLSTDAFTIDSLIIVSIVHHLYHSLDDHHPFIVAVILGIVSFTEIDVVFA